MRVNSSLPFPCLPRDFHASKTIPLCTLRSAFCTHKTPIVPRFFDLYRETEFFSQVYIRAILSHPFRPVWSGVQEMGNTGGSGHG